MNIKNIIFDLGGVIVDLEPQRSLSEFSKACRKTEKELREIIVENRHLFLDYETGMIDNTCFKKEIARIMNHEMSEFDFECAWNSIIGGVPPERIRLLGQLKLKYRLFLLSNTNDLHVKKIDEVFVASAFTTNLYGYFEKIYFSHLVHKRKPELEVFLQVLEENKLIPMETLFIDDMIENTEAAKKTGIHVLHVEQNNPQLEFLLHNNYERQF